MKRRKKFCAVMDETIDAQASRFRVKRSDSSWPAAVAWDDGTDEIAWVLNATDRPRTLVVVRGMWGTIPCRHARGVGLVEAGDKIPTASSAAPARQLKLPRSSSGMVNLFAPGGNVVNLSNGISWTSVGWSCTPFEAASVLRYRRARSTTVIIQPLATHWLTHPEEKPEAIAQYECDACRYEGCSPICSGCGEFCERGLYLNFTRQTKARVAEWLTVMLASHQKSGPVSLKTLISEALFVSQSVAVVYGMAHLLEFALDDDLFALPADHPLREP